MVGIAHVKLVGETGARLSIIYLSIASVAVTLVVFAVDTLADEPATAIALVVFIVLSILADRFWRYIPFFKVDTVDGTAVQTASDVPSELGT